MTILPRTLSGFLLIFGSVLLTANVSFSSIQQCHNCGTYIISVNDLPQVNDALNYDAVLDTSLSSESVYWPLASRSASSAHCHPSVPQSGNLPWNFFLVSFYAYDNKTDSASTAFLVAPKSTALRKVGDLFESVDDVFANPSLLKGRTPAQVRSVIGNTPGWKAGTLGKGSHKGQGFVFREFTSKGNPTGRIIQWHPGGGHHGAQPYWKVSSGKGGTVRIGPQFE